MSQQNTDVIVTTDLALKAPSFYDVIFYNDQRTPYEFVVLVLMHLFQKDYDTAVMLTNSIHTEGRNIVATYTYEIAATKRDETINTARANGHPLRVEIEQSSAGLPL